MENLLNSKPTEKVVWEICWLASLLKIVQPNFVNVFSEYFNIRKSITFEVFDISKLIHTQK